MSYSEDVVVSKLSSVNDTQESIVTISQWILFHRRHAGQTVKTWSKALADASPHRKLALIYLANEVVQQSRARKKEEFLKAFGPAIPESIETAYRQCSPELQAKIRRVTEVWRQRTIFTDDILNDLDTRLSDADKNKPKQMNTGRRLGQGNFSLPFELSKLSTALSDLTAKTNKLSQAVADADKIFADVTEAEALPAPMEYAAQIEKVLRSVNTAISTSDEALKSRRAYIDQLETLLAANKAALESETGQHAKLQEKLQTAVELKNSVEEMILEGSSKSAEDDREMESQEPEPVESQEPEPEVPDPVYSPLPASGKGEEDDGLSGLDPAIAQFLSSLTPRNTENTV